MFLAPQGDTPGQFGERRRRPADERPSYWNPPQAICACPPGGLSDMYASKRATAPQRSGVWLQKQLGLARPGLQMRLMRPTHHPCRHPHSRFCSDSLVRNLRRALPFTTAKVSEASFIVRPPCRNSLWMTLCMFSSGTASRTHLKARGISRVWTQASLCSKSTMAQRHGSAGTTIGALSSGLDDTARCLDGAVAACSLCV